ncbi:BgTH12-04805 [Blumeria graminis f. sp. triticale]|uniref:Bgt-1285 n=3 Tax=Blumeria graminis TaxID=34373 RepID=A0A061HHS7_BLUGR|nr:hypothetical protein BGT96224_1285 [Blumeria graminis f. sp. tritici 96224]CAD6499153.1 BgTH12-04805 [Blumeria graminis f. sp. triticale]VCU39268.1 Bgt-1285 [Blumeria graminis f. sp. tritici]
MMSSTMPVSGDISAFRMGSNWAEPETYRIEKPIRVRVLRFCHRCKTTFGSNTLCVICEHTKCKKCTRTPLKKIDISIESKKNSATVGTIRESTGVGSLYNSRSLSSQSGSSDSSEEES